VLIAIDVVLLTRFAVVYSLVPALNLLPGAKPIDHNYRFVLAWGGLRGALAIALAMSLPKHFPYRWQIDHRLRLRRHPVHAVGQRHHHELDDPPTGPEQALAASGASGSLCSSTSCPQFYRAAARAQARARLSCMVPGQLFPPPSTPAGGPFTTAPTRTSSSTTGRWARARASKPSPRARSISAPPTRC
jgi:hypothetical protein